MDPPDLLVTLLQFGFLPIRARTASGVLVERHVAWNGQSN